MFTILLKNSDRWSFKRKSYSWSRWKTSYGVHWTATSYSDSKKCCCEINSSFMEVPFDLNLALFIFINRFYKFRCFIEMAENGNEGFKKNFLFLQTINRWVLWFTVDESYFQILIFIFRKREARCLVVDLSTALWQWRQVTFYLT